MKRVTKTLEWVEIEYYSNLELKDFIKFLEKQKPGDVEQLEGMCLVAEYKVMDKSDDDDDREPTFTTYSVFNEDGTLAELPFGDDDFCELFIYDPMHEIDNTAASLTKNNAMTFYTTDEPLHIDYNKFDCLIGILKKIDSILS